MSDDIDYRVSSELYEEFDYSTSIKPSQSAENVVSKFAFNIPHSPQQDADGDLVVNRKNEITNTYELKIEHSKRTALSLVGLQIWRGALLLADWLIYNEKSLSNNGCILELGSGVGLTSIVAGTFTPVICTDIDLGGQLDLIRNNIAINKNLIRHPIKVLELDFTKDFTQDLLEVLPQARVVIAADVVYDDSLTEAFIDTVRKLMVLPPTRSIYVALEKRYVFTVDDCDTCAPCYEYFKECLHQVQNVTIEELPLDFPQYFHYERVKELVLWKITSNHGV